MPPAHPTSQHTQHISLLVSLDMHGQCGSHTHLLVCLCGEWQMGPACGRRCDHPAHVLLGCFLHFNLWTTQPNGHTGHSRIASSLSLSHRSVHSLVIVCGVAGLVAVWLSENYHSRLHTSTQPCYMYRTPSPIQTCMARTHTHSTLALVSQCHHPCYHALLVRGGMLRDTTEGGVAPRPCARTPHGSTLRGATGVDVLSRPRVFTLAW